MNNNNNDNKDNNERAENIFAITEETKNLVTLIS